MGSGCMLTEGLAGLWVCPLTLLDTGSTAYLP